MLNQISCTVSLLDCLGYVPPDPRAYGNWLAFRVKYIRAMILHKNDNKKGFNDRNEDISDNESISDNNNKSNSINNDLWKK